MRRAAIALSIVAGLLVLGPLFLRWRVQQHQGENLAFETIVKDKDGLWSYENPNPGIMVLTQSEDIHPLAESLLWIRPHLEAALRDIDYSRQFALLVFHGHRGTGGYSVTVNTIKRTGNRVEVHAAFAAPNPGDMTTQLATSPIHFVAISKENGTWGTDFTFVLIRDGAEVAETSHYIP